MNRFALLAACLAATPAFAATFTVTNTADSGAGSLRQAMLAANATADDNYIHFAIPGGGPHVIAPATALPQITRPVVIDGTTQPGAVKNTNTLQQGGLNSVIKIEIAGSPLVVNVTGPQATGAVTLRGLAIHSTGNSAAVVAYRHAGVHVQGCYIGTDASGMNVPAPIAHGIQVIVPKDVFIGAQTPAWRNLIAGATLNNGSSGIDATGESALGGMSSTGPFIEGNLIGTDATGLAALPNTTGITYGHTDGDLSGPGAYIRRNVISGNAQRGIAANCSFTSGGACGGGLRIEGNLIGTDAGGFSSLPNGSDGGITTYSFSSVPTRVFIGGDMPAQENLIAFNQGPGINHHAAGALDIGGNTILNLSGGGIDIGTPGPSPNDPGDADEGGNRGQNWPEILSATLADGVLSVRYRVDTAPAYASYPLRVQFFLALPGGGMPILADTGGASLGFAIDSIAQAQAQAVREVDFVLPPDSHPFPITAIATDAMGHSSEFGAPYDPDPDLFFDGFETP